MLYYSDEARGSAKDGIMKVIRNLTSVKPNDEFRLQDIEDAIHYLSILADAIDSEQNLVSRERQNFIRRVRNEQRKAERTE